MNNQKQAEGSSQAEGHAEYVISMKKENKTIAERFNEQFNGELWLGDIEKDPENRTRKELLAFIFQERTQWEQEMRQKIESLEATTWGNEVEYLAKDDVLALYTEHKGKKK